jgi:two-component system, OmpR family, sensor histidine kinase QseC
MRRWLAALRQPSLARRLVLSQMVVAAVLWVALMAYLALQISAESIATDLFQMRLGANAALPLAEALQDRPELLHATMQHLDAFQRSTVTTQEVGPELHLPRLYLWWDGRLVYCSADAPPDFRALPTGAIDEVRLNGVRWSVYAEDSADKRARFAALAPATAAGYGLNPWSRSWLLLPLAVSLPLLVFPAWLSVRFALRPWDRVSKEIAARGPGDLAPLAFTPPHRELTPLTHAVDQLMERMRQAGERERSFIADAAHELRTPIAAMRINAEALQTQGLTPRERELIDGVLTSNLRAGRLVEQLLTLTRSEAAPATSAAAMAPLDLGMLVQDQLAQLATLAQHRHIDLDLDLDSAAQATEASALLVCGDAESLRTLVDNLVGNAIKFAPAHSVVSVQVARSGRGGTASGRVALTVSDEGRGIDPALRERVFDRFYRAPDATHHGSGLGLAIVKTIADRHGASITLRTPAAGRGLVVEVCFLAQPTVH